MWTCGTCGREFANRNQVHTCALLRTLEEHFVDKDPAVRETFETVVATVARLGPDGPDDVDAEVEGWLTEAYAVGRQEHLRS